MAMALSPGQIGGYWLKAYPKSSTNLTTVMVAISLAESSGNPSAIQQGQPYARTGWGLWQITPGDSEPSVGKDHELLDPEKNAEAAYLKYKAQGLSAWSTYTSGAYARYMQAARDAQGDFNVNAAIDNPSNSTADPTQGIPGANAFGDAVNKDLGVTAFLGDLGSLLFTEKGWMRLLKIAAGVIIGVIAIKALFQDTFVGNAAGTVQEKGKGFLSGLIKAPEEVAEVAA